MPHTSIPTKPSHQGWIHIHAFGSLHTVGREHAALLNKQAVVGRVGVLGDDDPGVVAQRTIVDGYGETVHGFGTFGSGQASGGEVDLRINDDKHAVFFRCLLNFLIFSVFLVLILVSATGHDQGCDEHHGSNECFFHDINVLFRNLRQK